MQLVVDEYTDSTHGQRQPTLVLHTRKGQTLLLIADATESAFSRAFQPLVDVARVNFKDKFRSEDGSVREKMRSACREIEAAMRDHFKSTPEFGDESYSLAFAALGLEEWKIFPIWIGSLQAKLFRDDTAIQSTRPHVTAIPNSDVIVTDRSMTTCSTPNASIEEDESWSLLPNDTIVLADHRLFSLFSDQELSKVVGNTKGNAAQALVETAQIKKYRFAQSAIVANVAG